MHERLGRLFPPIQEDHHRTRPTIINNEAKMDVSVASIGISAVDIGVSAAEIGGRLEE